MALHAKQEAAVSKVIELTPTRNGISAPLLEATSALAKHLVQSEPFLRFQEAEKKLHADHDAMRLLTEFEGLQKTIHAQQHHGTITTSEIKRLRELQNLISANDTIQEYEQAQEMAIKFLREVNQEISSLLGVDFASLTRRSSGCC